MTTYDAANRLSKVAGTLWGVTTNYVSGTAYAAHGAPTAYLFGNGIQRSFSYNNRLQTQEILDVDTVHGSWGNCGNKPQGLSSSTMDMDLQLSWVASGAQQSTNNGNLAAGLVQTCTGVNLGSAMNYGDSFSYDNVNRIISFTDNGGA